MPYPVIILGAGASHDSVPSDKMTVKGRYIPPLSDNLLSSTSYEDTISQFGEVKDLAADISGAVPHRMSLEERMEQLKERGAKNGERVKQLIAFEFYLQKLFQTISKEFAGQSASNYRALVGYVNDHCNRQACFVTFNYDLLLEESLGIDSKLSSYIDGLKTLIKLHGSCDWMYILGSPDSFGGFGRFKTSYEFFMKNPDFLTRPGSSKPSLFPKRCPVYEHIEGTEKCLLYPAVAIPLLGKDHDFICPREHINTLAEALGQAQKILVIGWRAGDQKFINFLKQYKPKGAVQVRIVASGEKSAQEVSKKLSEIDGFITEASKAEGFTSFIRSGECEDFFQDEFDPRS